MLPGIQLYREYTSLLKVEKSQHFAGIVDVLDLGAAKKTCKFLKWRWLLSS
jgi:hypothetical protein